MTTEQLAKYAAVLALLGPIGAVGAARHFGAGAQRASAAVVQPVPELPVFGSERVDVAVDTQGLTDPFLRTSLVEFPAVVVRPEPGGSEEQPDLTVPGFTLTSVMPHPSRPLAVIDGRARKIGDTIVPGWELVAIDGRARSVTVKNSQGRTHTVRLQRNIP